MRIRNTDIPNLPAYDLDYDGSDAPWVWYGGDALNAAAAPWSSAPLGSTYTLLSGSAATLYTKTASGTWLTRGEGLVPPVDNTSDLGSATSDYATGYIRNIVSLSKLGTNTLYVDPKGTGTYTTLSAALAAITDASDSNEYLIVVTGEVAETAAITAKSHVNVLFLAGASVTVTSTSTLNAVNFSSLTNTTWAAVGSSKPHIIRAGAVGGASHGLYTTGCASTVRFTNLNALNTTSGVGSCHGVFNNASSSPTMTNCTGIGGAGGAGCYGIYNNASSNPTMTNCTGIGGAGGANSYGILNNTSSSPTMTNCTGIGGAGGAGCSGIYNASASNPTMTNCTGTGGAGGTGCIGIYNSTSSNPTMTGCTGINQRFSASATIAASSRQEDTFQPTASHPWRIIAVRINVTAAAAAGVTLTLRDATGGGGNALSGAIAVDAVAATNFPITGHRVITAGNNIFAYLSASDATLAYTLTYVYETCYATSYGLYQDTDAPCTIQDCTFVSNAASAAIYVTNNGDDRSVFIGGTARSGRNDGTREKAIVCQSAWNPGQVYNMVLDGGSTNLTAAAGTANGSNVEL